MEEHRNAIAVESFRLINFLQNNQLVQANAVCSKMENLFQEKIRTDFEAWSADRAKGSCQGCRHAPIQSEGRQQRPSSEPREETIQPPESLIGIESGPAHMSQGENPQEPASKGMRRQVREASLTGQVSQQEPALCQSEPKVNQNNPHEPSEALGCKYDVSSPEKNVPLVENHPLWKPFKESIRAKQFILSGKTKAAIEAAKRIVSLV